MEKFLVTILVCGLTCGVWSQYSQAGNALPNFEHTNVLSVAQWGVQRLPYLLQTRSYYMLIAIRDVLTQNIGGTNYQFTATVMVDTNAVT